MPHGGPYVLEPIGFVRSTLVDRASAPRQGNEGAPAAWIDVEHRVVDGLDGLDVGQEIIVVTWFHASRRDVLKTRPRWDPDQPLTGVFATRSPDRPNPLGLHRVTILEKTARGVYVAPLEAIDGTPVVDLKPVLEANDA